MNTNMENYDVNVAELLSFRLHSSSFEILDDEKVFDGGNLNVLCELTLVDSEDKESPLVGNASVSVEALDPEDNSTLFKSSYTYVALYDVYDEKLFFSLTEKQRADCCLEKIYTMIREDVMYCLNRAGLRQIHLPFNFKSHE